MLKETGTEMLKIRARENDVRSWSLDYRQLCKCSSTIKCHFLSFSSAIAKTYSPDRLTSRRSITELFLTIKMPKTIYPCNFLLAVIIFSVFSVSQTKIKYRNRRVISPYKRNKSWIISNSYLPWHFVGLKPAAWWNLVMYGLIFLSLLGSGPTLILSSRQNAIGVITNKCKLEKTNNILSNCMV